MPPIMRDIVTAAFANEPDVEVVGAADKRSLQSTLMKLRPDVLVVGRHRPDLTFAQEVWAHSPYIKVLMISGRGRSAVVYALRPERMEVGDVSPAGLVAAIRDACNAARP